MRLIDGDALVAQMEADAQQMEMSVFKMATYAAINDVKHQPTVEPQLIRCKDCKKAPKCYGDVLMKSKSGGYIYCPVEYCSEAERRSE